MRSILGATSGTSLELAPSHALALPAKSQRRLLMIAYHFPPLAGSSGIQRTLRFAQQLPEFGWDPMVLSAHPRAYERTNDDLMNEVPHDMLVRRAFALDAARHLSIAGRYPLALAIPDRWASWRFDGVRVGMDMIRRYRPCALWSTYPIATAHVIAAELQRRSGLPWVADFRDPMVQPAHPYQPAARAKLRLIEAEVIRHARLTLFTTPGAAADCATRHPDQGHRIATLENGYDEASFVKAGQRVAATHRTQTEPKVLLHSGIVYPDERDPTQLFAALRLLHDEGSIRPGHFLLRLRAAVHEDTLRTLSKTLGVEAYVELAPPVRYVDALAEMLSVGALLVLQARNCNHQVPAKLYEYLRAGRPIIALTDLGGDTARVMRDAGVTRLASLDDVDAIAALLRHYLMTDGPDLLPRQDAVRRASRRSRAGHLAEWLERTCTPPHAVAPTAR